MKSKLSRIFGAAAIAGAGILGTAWLLQDKEPALVTLTDANKETIAENGQTLFTVAQHASLSSVVSPDMRTLTVEALRELADKSSTDQLTLTADSETGIQEAMETPRPGRFVEHVAGDQALETLAYIYIDMAMRAAERGMSIADIEAATTATINEMLAKLDSHSSYHTPEETKKMMEGMSGHFGGIGLQLEEDNGIATVQNVMETGPSKNANIQKGDRIVAVNGEDVTTIGLDATVEKIRGEIGTDVTITIERAGERLDPQVITRDVIKQSTVRAQTIGSDIGMVSVSSFGNETAADIEAEIIKMRTTLPGMRGFILDLRGNPGGLLPHAIAVSDLFLENGNIVSIGNGDPKTDRYSAARPGDILNGLPMVVLMSNGSASASEIVAGALQDNKRAPILGMQSFGKGSVQTVIPLQHNGGALRLTTQLYFTASGASIQGNGITPNIAYEDEELRKLKADPEFKQRREADLSHTLPNPNLVKDTTQTTEICEPQAGVGPANVPATDESLKVTLRDKTEIVDFIAACAVEMLRPGAARSLTGTRPVVPGPAPAP